MEYCSHHYGWATQFGYASSWQNSVSNNTLSRTLHKLFMQFVFFRQLPPDIGSPSAALPHFPHCATSLIFSFKIHLIKSKRICGLTRLCGLLNIQSMYIHVFDLRKRNSDILLYYQFCSRVTSSHFKTYAGKWQTLTTYISISFLYFNLWWKFWFFIYFSLGDYYVSVKVSYVNELTGTILFIHVFISNQFIN